MLDLLLVVAGVLALVVGALFATLERWSVSPPLLGLVVGVAIGPHALDVVSLAASGQFTVLHTASRLLLAVALMAIALRYPISAVRGRARDVVLLVGVALPAMAGLTALGAGWILGLGLGGALVLGAVLSPTDPVLASGLVAGDAAEADVAADDREVLSLESGTNDGLALPLVVLAVAVAAGGPMPAALGDAVYSVAVAVGVGVLAGLAAGWALRWAEAHREVGSTIRSLYTLVLAVFVLGVCGLLGADGLLGVFAAGLAHSAVVTAGDRQGEVAIDEAMNQFLVLPVFVLLGIALPLDAWSRLGWGGAAFVAFVLLVRRLPVLLVLRAPLRISWAQAAWRGWFGPIGVAAVYYLTGDGVQGLADERLWAAGSLLVAASTVAHGLTAAPGRAAYRRALGTGGASRSNAGRASE